MNIIKMNDDDNDDDNAVFNTMNDIHCCNFIHTIVDWLADSSSSSFFLRSVSQTCNEDGMEFTLRTPEGFYGRIYTYGFYDR